VTCDLDALQAASLLQAAYIRRGEDRHVSVTDRGLVLIQSLTGWVAIAPDFALHTARTFWQEIDP
jgi:uncharacterized membrane protein